MKESEQEKIDREKTEAETKEAEAKAAAANSNDGKSTEEKKLSPLEEARKFNKDTSEMLEAMKGERAKIEAAAADMLVNGKSLAGQVQKKETEQEKWQREAKERYDGTGMDPTPDDSPTVFN